VAGALATPALTTPALTTPALASPSRVHVQAGSLPPHPANPAHNLQPVPDYHAVCAARRAAACRQDILAAINRAHRHEHRKPVVLPRDFTRLSAAEQVFVSTDLERISRHLPPVLGLTAQLDRYALAGARADRDPGFPSRLGGGDALRAAGSVWSSAFSTLDPDYNWMYLDGWGGPDRTPNEDCTSARAPGCWAHRDILTGEYGRGRLLIAGAGFVAGHSPAGGSATEIVVAATGPVPTFRYSWRQAVIEGAH
jgi:hypothetical protein